ncbi:MAG TPA: cupin [Mycobacterium sp.]|nr:cupin [Mycobacterium sp.]
MGHHDLSTLVCAGRRRNRGRIDCPATRRDRHPRAGHGRQVIWQTSDDGKDYIFREITIAPGGSTGWHSHDGELLGVVKEGVLTHYRSDCTLDGTYTIGQSIAEKGGPGYVHIGRNLGPEPLVLQVLYIDPAGAPLSDDAPDPGCGFA